MLIRLGYVASSITAKEIAITTKTGELIGKEMVDMPFVYKNLETVLWNSFIIQDIKFLAFIIMVILTRVRFEEIFSCIFEISDTFHKKKFLVQNIGNEEILETTNRQKARADKWSYFDQNPKYSEKYAWHWSQPGLKEICKS